MKVKIWGTRAQVSSPHPRTQIYGGNTVCVEIQAENAPALILDAGMGIHWLGNHLMKGAFGRGQGQGHILLTHVHWDHIQGIPFFAPMLIPGNHLTIYGPDAALRSQLLAQMQPAFCPVPNFFSAGIGADIEVKDLSASEFSIGAVKVKTVRIHHCDDAACLGFRLEADGRSIAYLPDVEYLTEAHRQQTISLADGVDLLFHDAMLKAEEYPDHLGQGHCSIDDGIDIASRAAVGKLILFSHHPDRSDVEIDAMLKAATGNGIAIDAASEGTEYTLCERNELK